MPNKKDREQAAKDRYFRAAHGVQSATLFMQSYERKNQEWHNKDLRTGLNMAMADQGALSTLLIRKGIITEIEYYEALAEAAELELYLRTNDARERTGNQGLHFE